MTNPKKKFGERSGLPVEIGPFRIVSLDPGGTTGVASVSYHGGVLSSIDQLEFYSSEFGPEEHHLELWDYLGDWNFKTIVCESFEFRQHVDKNKAKMKVELVSKEYIGLAKLYAATREIPIHFHTASAAKGLIPDTGPQKNVKLKQLGWSHITPGGHANDAARHLVYYLVRKTTVRSIITQTWLTND